ncbi:Uncharacterised protein [Vibrio cholerae]|nr:Uncharacterised protein [Vibrio cholerae]CSI64081.1 Uncharacterised protein [Vibrio cholerae]
MDETWSRGCTQVSDRRSNPLRCVKSPYRIFQYRDS